MANRPGRPRIDASGEPPARVHLTLTAGTYDRAERLAKQQRESIQDVIRRSLTRLLKDETGGRI